MHLHYIKLWNFRKYSLSDDSCTIKDDNCGLCVEFQPSLNVLVGQNDSGKTAVIDAIRYLLDTNSQERTWISEDDFHVYSTEMRIEACFLFENEKDAIATCAPFVEHLSTKDGNPVLYVTLNAKISQRKVRGQRYIDRSITSGVNGNGNTIEGEIREFLRTTYLKPLRDARTEMSAGRGSRLSQILFNHKDIIKKGDGLIEAFVEANEKIESNDAISETQKKLNVDYFKKLLFESDPMETKIKMADAISVKDLSESQKAYILRRILERLNLNIFENGSELSLAHGLGYNNLMYMATEMLLIEQDSSENLPLLLIEEPEAHLHPQMQLQLLEFLKGQDNVQTILTTHSPILASKVPLDSMILLSNNKAFGLKRGLTRLDVDDYHFLEIFLDSTKANLFFARGIIVVEGDAENILIPVLAKLLGCPLEKYGISIVNVGHIGLFRFSRILQRSDPTKDNEIPIKVACVTDRDLRPDVVMYENDADKSDTKYVKKTSDNEKTFRRYYNDITLSTYLASKKINDGQNVVTFVSPHWTLEYDLANAGFVEELASSLYTQQAMVTEVLAFNTSDEKAARAYRSLHQKSKSKSETAYRLADVLSKKYWNNEKCEAKDTQELQRKLPKYLLEMFEHVTGKTLLPAEEGHNA